MGTCAKKKGGCIKTKFHYHFVIPTERSDEESLMLTLRSFTTVQDDIAIRQAILKLFVSNRFVID